MVEAPPEIAILDDGALRRLLDNIPVGIGIAEPVEEDGTVRPDARIIYYNKRWVEMFGFDIGDVQTVEQATWRLYPDPEVHKKMIRMRNEAAARRRADGKSEQTEIRAMGAGGEWLELITGTTVVGQRLVVTMLDITERKRAELALAAAGARERLAIDAAGLAFWSYDFASGKQQWDDAMFRIYGITRGNFSGNWEDYAHPADLDEALAAVDDAIAARAPVARQSFRVLLPGGAVRHIDGAMSIAYNDDGKPLGLVGVNSDVTNLRKAEDKLRDALMNLPIPVVCGTNAQPAEIVLVNKAFTETFGYAHGEIPTVQRWTELAFPDPGYRAEVLAQWEEDLRANGDGAPGPVGGREVRIRCKDGSTREVVFHATLSPDGPIVACQDITATRRNAAAMAEARSRMNVAARVARLGFWHFHARENREEWDENLCDIYGSDPADNNPRWEKFLHPEDREAAEKRFREALEEGGVYDSEFRIVRPDGEVRHIRECGFVMHDAQGRAVASTGADIDVTGQKLAEQRQRESEAAHRAELERKLKTSLAASSVAHEINQPLSAILLDSRMALERMRGDSPEIGQAREFLASTIARAERVVQTSNKMMSLLRSVKTEHKTVDLRDVVRSAALYAKDGLLAKSVALETRGTGRATRIRGDEGQLVIAVSNLLRNAIEAVSLRAPGSGRIVLSLERRENEIILAVGDNGPGLDADALAEIPLSTTKPGGAGLGLFIVKAVAENHAAKLESGRSREGGAELRLVFPAAVSPAFSRSGPRA